MGAPQKRSRPSAKAAPRGPKQLRVRLSPHVDAARPLPEPSELDAWLLRAVSGLGRRKIPLVLGDGGAAWIAGQLQRGGEALAPVVERMHRLGARRPDSALARRAAMLDDSSTLRDLLGSDEVKVQHVESDNELLRFDVDTPEAYAEIQERIHSGR